jgi:hypothetical protein
MKRNLENSTKYNLYLLNKEQIDLNFIKFDKDWGITINKFPYNLEKDIFHYVLWFNSSEERSIQEIENVINRINPKPVWFINSVENRSVKTFFHVHIFTKNFNFI